MSSMGKPYVGALLVLLVAGCEQRMERDRTESAPQRTEPGARERGESTSEPRVMPARPRTEDRALGWESAISSWPEKARSAAQEIVKKYGPPDEFTGSKLMWNKRGQWKRISVSREEIPHEWPAPHVDMVEQFVDMRVPPDLFDDLAKFDGSVIAERTKGEISARCGGEAANFLAINLANDIVTGKRTFRDARNYYAKAMQQKQQGGTDPYLERLVFEVPSGGTADPDKPEARPAQGTGRDQSTGREQGMDREQSDRKQDRQPGSPVEPRKQGSEPNESQSDDTTSPR